MDKQKILEVFAEHVKRCKASSKKLAEYGNCTRVRCCNCPFQRTQDELMMDRCIAVMFAYMDDCKLSSYDCIAQMMKDVQQYIIDQKLTKEMEKSIKHAHQR